MLTALVLLCSMTSSECRNFAEVPDQTELPFMCLKYGQEEAAKVSGAGGQVRQGAMRPQERATDYPVVFAWSCFLLFIGASAFVLGMALHNEAIAQHKPPTPEPIYYCATGAELPAFEPRRDRKDQRDI